LLGRAQAEDLLLAAAVDGVRDRDAVRAGRAGSIELQHRGARPVVAAVRAAERAGAARAGAENQEDDGVRPHGSAPHPASRMPVGNANRRPRWLHRRTAGGASMPRAVSDS
jgi:hypothetical protein